MAHPIMETVERGKTRFNFNTNLVLFTNKVWQTVDFENEIIFAKDVKRSDLPFEQNVQPAITLTMLCKPFAKARFENEKAEIKLDIMIRMQARTLQQNTENTITRFFKACSVAFLSFLFVGSILPP
mmetsp:Transcript_5597/g.11852  ORF Transcript_5597/g.11852 Transcript_5597/m.11852 type:complete len:126 (+) Transcript_5597:1148-1525(+)